MLEFRWQFFLVSAPIFWSLSSMRMHISDSSCTCFGSSWSVETSGILAADRRCLMSLKRREREDRVEKEWTGRRERGQGEERSRQQGVK